MKRGLVIGKFMPVHQGHIALIHFAASQCDELIVSMSHTPNDPINGELRFSWMQEIFHTFPNINLYSIEDNFDDTSLALPERTKEWAERMRQVYPPIDILFSSEEYGIPFAANMSAEHRSFDPERKTIPISATLIRTHPFRYWDFIPEVV